MDRFGFMKRYQSWHHFFFVLGSIVLVVATLFFARAVLIPVVLSVLLALVLTPPCLLLERAGLPRLLSVMLVVAFACLVVAALGGIIIMQIQALAFELPSYKNTLITKAESLYETGQSSWSELFEAFTEISQKIKKMDDKAEQKSEPVPVTIEETQYLSWLQTTLGTTAEFLLNLGLIVILVTFVLLTREDLRNRFIRLSGTQSLASMTQALDDAQSRISRYLLMQLIINASYGLTLAIGLAVIGVPYAMLWGFLSGVLRYVPYLGPVLGAAFPMSLSIAVFEDWTPFIWTTLFIIVLEIFSNNVMETWLYGRSIGVSSVAVLVSAVFWTWVWGPLGLVLSTPLTASLAVLGHYVPAFNFLEVILGDRPVLPRHITLFQRLLAKDEDEANELVREYMVEHPLPKLYDNVLLPMLHRAKSSHDRDDLTHEDLEYIYRQTGSMLDELTVSGEPVAGEGQPEPVRVRIIGCPVRDQADEFATKMFGNILDQEKFDYRALPEVTLLGELHALIEEEQPEALCLFATPPGGITQTRLLCKKMHREFPDLKLLVVCWTRDAESPQLAEQFANNGAAAFSTTLLGLRDKLHALFPVLASQAEEHATP